MATVRGVSIPVRGRPERTEPSTKMRRADIPPRPRVEVDATVTGPLSDHDRMEQLVQHLDGMAVKINELSTKTASHGVPSSSPSVQARARGVAGSRQPIAVKHKCMSRQPRNQYSVKVSHRCVSMDSTLIAKVGRSPGGLTRKVSTLSPQPRRTSSARVKLLQVRSLMRHTSPTQLIRGITVAQQNSREAVPTC